MGWDGNYCFRKCILAKGPRGRCDLICVDGHDVTADEERSQVMIGDYARCKSPIIMLFIGMQNAGFPDGTLSNDHAKR